MSKKQLLALAFVAAIPATGLFVKMLFSLGHILTDQSSAGAMIWVIYVICLLGSLFFATLPLWLGLYYPAAGFEGAAASVGALPHPSAGIGGNAPVVSDDEDEDTEDADDEAPAEDDGEAYFEEDALEEDFDEFDGGFDDDDK